MPLWNPHAIDGPWLDMILVNNWIAGSIPPQYMKDSRGQVHLRGRVVSPSGLSGVNEFWIPPVGFQTFLVSNGYWNFTGGALAAGTELEPRSLGILVNGLYLICNYNTSGVADTTAGVVTEIDRFSWSTL